MGETSPSIGTLLDGKYRLLSRLGAGGMSVVFRAENVLTGKHVALKWLRPDASGDRSTSERLLREARAASSLRHPGVVDVYDVGQSGPSHFLVMELLEGETLRQFLLRSPAPAVPELIARLLPAFDGVAAAHARNIVHRDLKPENIFLERVPGADVERAKVLDFGIAKLRQERSLALTLTGVVIGTPSYMSLEQLRGDRDVDARADVYALGVILYEALAGRLPHEAVTLPELAIKVATGVPAALASLRPDIPMTLARIIDWALAREPDQRLPSVHTFRNELELFAREQGFRSQMAEPDAVLPRLPDPNVRARRSASGESVPYHSLNVAQSQSFTLTDTPTLPSRRRALRGGGAASLVLGAIVIGAWMNRAPQSMVHGKAAFATPSGAAQTAASMPPPPAHTLEPAVTEVVLASAPLQASAAPPRATDSCPPPQRPPARSVQGRASDTSSKAAPPPSAQANPGTDASGDKPRLKRADIAKLLAF